MPGAFGPRGPVVEGPPRRGSSTKAQRPPRRGRSSARPDALGAGPCAGGETLGRCRNSGIIGMVCTLGIYTSLHDIWYIKSYIYLSIYLPIYLSTYLPIYLSTYLPIYLSTYLSTYLSIHPCIHPSIHPSIHLSTHIHTVNIIAGKFFVWWLVLFLHTVVSIWRYLWSFFMGVFNYWHIIVYYSVIWDHEVDKNPSQSLINN